MSELREYEVQLSGGITTSMLLDDETAKSMNAKPKVEKKAPEEKPAETKKAAAPQNKARAAESDKAK